MAQIAFILLCHRDPEAIIAQAKRLTAAGDCVAIHFDARAPRDAFRTLAAALDGKARIALVRPRIRCGWGQWSLVRATLRACQTALKAFPEATHLYMISGDCMPIKSARYAHAHLNARDVDYIESVDFLDSDWIKTGMREDRLIYRHLVNERTHKWLFYQSLDLQRRLGLARKIPADLRVMIGSQWWCLRRKTVDQILAFCRSRPDVLRFFATTWIPDETFFQTLVRHLVPRDEIDNRTLTFLMFTDYGMPATFHDDHHDLLLAQDALFARKISPEAHHLKERLGALWVDEDHTFQISDEGRRLHAFLTGQGRTGDRFAPRIWESGGRMRRGERLILVACKKWHVAKRLTEGLRQRGGLPAYDYVFNEETPGLPDLGGIENRLDKRTRHRRALIRLLFDAQSGNRMLICVDPAAVHLVEDLAGDRGDVRVLDIACPMDDGWLAGHARRVGLIGDATAPEAVADLLPTLRRAIGQEQVRLSEAAVADFARIEPTAPFDHNAQALARVLEMSQEEAASLLTEARLFED